MTAEAAAPQAPPAYAALETLFARLNALDNALGILHWDQETTMPEGATDGRAGALAALEVLRHELLTAPETADRLAEAADRAAALDAWQQANLREMRRLHAHATAVPAALVGRAAHAQTVTEVAWRAARRDNDFAGLLPRLQEVFEIAAEIARIKGAALGLAPYDAWLDAFEAGLTTADIDPLFDDLAGFLPGFTQEVAAAQAAAPPPERPAGPFPVDRQRDLGRACMVAAGFDFARGRLDISTHPFCGGADDDVRITTRYDEADFTSALMGVLHETGHALYEQGRPRRWQTQPVGASRGMAMHESQSLILEMQACRSREFLGFAAGEMRRAFAAATDTGGAAWEPDNLHRLYTRVAPGLIRVDADEVTYPAHIILRYRLERALLDGDLAMADLPGAWADGMRDLLGIVPPDDRTGCLQDIHWPGGAWGYFPTYTLGAMIAAQLFAAATAEDGDIRPGLARGDFSPLVAWLRRNVHGQGCLLGWRELLVEATGRPLDPAVFKAHLTARYLDG